MTNAVSVAQYGSSGTTLGFKNRLINGNMVINQRGYSGTPTSGTYTLDRYFYNSDSTRITISQSSTAPAGFSNSILVTSNAASSISTGQFTNLCQIIEGYNMTDLAWGTASAQTVTLSFWVYCSLTGTFGGAVRNAGSGGYYGYPFTYTISAANTWTYVSVTIPGPTNTTYAWNGGNSQGMYVWWDFGTGTTYTNTAGTWVNQNVVGANGTTKLVNTNGATWYMTGAQLEVGPVATTYDFLPYTTELQLCQRYYWKIVNPHLAGVASNASNVNRMGASYPVTMRAAPSISYSGTIFIYDGSGSSSVTSASSIYANTSFFELDATLATGGTAGQRPAIAYLDNTATGYFSISAEL
jgi:hypothetical protein